MTISSTTRVAGPFTGNGTASTFPFTFKVFSAADLFVQRVTIADGTTTTLVLTTDYTVSLNGNQNTNPGGSITLVAGALASGYTLTITSDIDNVQPTDLTNQGGFYPEVITDSLDRATIQIQQVADTANNAVHAPISDGALDMTLPVKELRTGKFLSFSAAGLPIVSDGTVTPDVTSGGNVTITANDAGANVDRDVVFVDNTTERMRLKGATGRLGIGTAAPSSALHVVGDSTVTGNASVGLGMTVDTNVLVVDATNNRVGVNKTSPTVALDVTGAAAISGNLAVNTDTMFVNSAGNAVGIGTTAPFTKLGIHSATSSTSMRITNVTTGTPASAAGLELNIFNNDAGITNNQNGAVLISTNGAVGGTPALKLTSAGLFGVGSDTPAAAMHVTTGSTGAYFSRVANDTGATNSTFLIATPNASAARLYGYGGIDFYTAAIGSSAAVRVQINSTGEVSVNSPSITNGRVSVRQTTNGEWSTINEHSNTNPFGMYVKYTGASPNGTSNQLIRCDDSTATRFQVLSNGTCQNTTGLYTTTSDIKLKEQVVDASSQWDDIKAVRIVNYKMREDVSHLGAAAPLMLGVIAQELEVACPGLVYETDDLDANNQPTGTTTKAVKQSILYMKAVKALQEAMSRIESLEARVAALEAGT